MKNKLRTRFAVVYIIFGAMLLGLQFAGIVDDFWGGMGTAFLFLGALFLYRSIKYKTNESYRENVDTQVNDERNHFLAMKAWSWAGYLFVLVAAAAAIVLRVMGMHDMSLAASTCIGIILLLYFGSYMVLKRKY